MGNPTSKIITFNTHTGIVRKVFTKPTRTVQKTTLTSNRHLHRSNFRHIGVQLGRQLQLPCALVQRHEIRVIPRQNPVVQPVTDVSVVGGDSPDRPRRKTVAKIVEKHVEILQNGRVVVNIGNDDFYVSVAPQGGAGRSDDEIEFFLGTFIVQLCHGEEFGFFRARARHQGEVLGIISTWDTSFWYHVKWRHNVTSRGIMTSWRNVALLSAFLLSLTA